MFHIVLVLAFVSQALFATEPSRRGFIKGCGVSVALGTASYYVYNKYVVDPPITEADLRNGGFSSDDLVNARQRVANVTEIYVEPLALSGPGSVGKRKMIRFLNTFLDIVKKERLGKDDFAPFRGNFKVVVYDTSTVTTAQMNDLAKQKNLIAFDYRQAKAATETCQNRLQRQIDLEKQIFVSFGIRISRLASPQLTQYQFLGHPLESIAFEKYLETLEKFIQEATTRGLTVVDIFLRFQREFFVVVYDSTLTSPIPGKNSPGLVSSEDLPGWFRKLRDIPIPRAPFAPPPTT